MGGMWPRMYNLAERGVSARGQVWALGTSGFFGNLVPGWAESHSSTRAKGRWVLISQKQGASLFPTLKPVLWAPRLCPTGPLPPPKPAPRLHQKGLACGREQGQEGPSPEGKETIK